MGDDGLLNLKSDTDLEWATRALAGFDEVLLDHAHCEKKAASTALNLIFRYTQFPEFMQPLSELAREELAHFELVLDHLNRRHIPFRRQDPSPYAADLMTCIRKEEPHKLLDTFLCCSLIEARSCERMQILAEVLEDQELKNLYSGLLASEARHHSTYINLAACKFDREEVMTRLAEIAVHEAAVIAAAPKIPRFHT
ncbi:MAG: tRNA-(ms[2]io[6]A)-hydroxylase [Planctomycetota bacterium]